MDIKEKIAVLWSNFLFWYCHRKGLNSTAGKRYVIQQLIENEYPAEVLQPSQYQSFRKGFGDYRFGRNKLDIRRLNPKRSVDNELLSTIKLVFMGKGELRIMCSPVGAIKTAYTKPNGKSIVSYIPAP